MLEREDQLARIQAAARSAAGGSGRAVLVEAPAGLGKTTLLEAGTEAASAGGLEVRAARGRELEREMPFGVARQLLGEVAERPEQHAVIHALFWQAAECAEDRALALVVDDAHAADEPSLRWLAYLSARIADLPLLVLVAARPGGRLLDDLEAERLRLSPLSTAAVATLAGGEAEPAFAEACRASTAGNPFLVGELLAALRREGLPLDAANATRVGAADAGPLLARLHRLEADELAVIRAAAVLGADAHIHNVAAVAELEVAAAQRIADRLARAALLRDERPLEFVHPLVREAVDRDLAAGERSLLHGHAARLLADAPGRAAAHVLMVDPAGDAAMVALLRDAAAAARAAGAPETAARYLRRALEEPPVGATRARVHYELGHALIGIDVAGAARHFAEAAAEPELAVHARRWQAQALGFGGAPGDAVAAGDAALARTGDDAEQSQLVAATRDFYALGWLGDEAWPERSAALRAQAPALRGDTAAERRVLATAAFDIACRGGDPAGRALEYTARVRRALEVWLDADDGVETAGGIGQTSIIADDPLAAERHERAAASALRLGRLANAGVAYAQLAHIRARHGLLVQAEADAHTSWELLGGRGESAPAFHWWSLAALLEVLDARGMADEARTLAEATGVREADLQAVCSFPSVPLVPVVLAQLDGDAGSLRRDGLRLERAGWSNPALNPWRAVVSLLDSDPEIVAPALDGARTFGAPWALGLCLRAAGTSARDPELLREAIAVLEPAGCRLELARAQLALGALLRRSNQRAEGREHLRLALDLAHRCGAAGVAGAASQELAATGARPRSVMLSGVESLTASERRVADLAAAGLSNPEIAKQLFVTRKTVETHLGHVYMKLDIASRSELPDALRA